MIAWTPFIEPLNLFHEWWYLLIVPLSFGISVIYKAMRLPDMSELLVQAVIMTIQIVCGMIALAIVLALFVQLVIPMLPVR